MLPAEIREARIKTAATKIVRILRQHVACHQKELERRVCEVGYRFYPKAPPQDRPEPVHLLEARQRLRRQDLIDSVERTVRGNTYNFWFLTETDPAVVAGAVAVKLAATDQFDRIHHDMHLSGFAAERMHWNAVGQAPEWFRLPYVSGQDITRVNGHAADHGVDLAAVHMPTTIRVVGQVKNTREWYYPNSPTVWQLLASAAQLDAVPVLIARRIAEPTFLFMEDVGGFALPTFNTYIHRVARARPDWADFEAAALTLGYKDVKVVDPETPEPRLVTPWSATLPPRLVAMKKRFEAVGDQVISLGIDEGLQDDIRVTLVGDVSRDDAFHEFWASLTAGPDADPTHPSEF